MAQFTQTPANLSSVKARRLVQGVGVNDAPYVVMPSVNGRQSHATSCPFYLRWLHMLQRCYADEKPQYANATVCDEWLGSFMAFRAWMELHPWQGNEIDKDILMFGNTLYHPNRCCFVPGWLNTMITEGWSSGKYPNGVTKQTDAYRKKPFRVRVRPAPWDKSSSLKHIGYFETEDEARAAYCLHKAEVLSAAADNQSDPRIENGLRVHAAHYVDEAKRLT